MRMLRYFPSIVITDNRSCVVSSPDRVGEIFYIIANSNDHLICDKAPADEIQGQRLRHLPEYQSCLVKVYGQ